MARFVIKTERIGGRASLKDSIFILYVKQFFLKISVSKTGSPALRLLIYIAVIGVTGNFVSASLRFPVPGSSGIILDGRGLMGLGSSTQGTS
jgi:hypothetical protein